MLILMDYGLHRLFADATASDGDIALRDELATD
jgi:hypothetical protein